MIAYTCGVCGYESDHLFRKGKHLVCFRCEERLDSVPSFDWAPETTVFWKRPDGTFTLPANRDAKIPPEYERVEVQATADKRRIVSAIDREEREKWERVQVGKQRLNEADESARRSALRDRMGSMSPITRDFAKYAMDQNNSRPRAKYTGAFYLQALEFDASNREPYRGVDGLDRGRK